jgi:hypothetical protein
VGKTEAPELWAIKQHNTTRTKPTLRISWKKRKSSNYKRTQQNRPSSKDRIASTLLRNNATPTEIHATRKGGTPRAWPPWSEMGTSNRFVGWQSARARTSSGRDETRGGGGEKRRRDVHLSMDSKDSSSSILSASMSWSCPPSSAACLPITANPRTCVAIEEVKGKHRTAGTPGRSGGAAAYLEAGGGGGSGRSELGAGSWSRRKRRDWEWCAVCGGAGAWITAAARFRSRSGRVGLAFSLG